MAKRLTFKRRLQNVWYALRHPGFLVGFSVMVGVCATTMGLAFPCGKHSQPIHGICDNGYAFSNPFAIFCITTVLTFILVLLIASGDQDHTQERWSNKGFVRDIVRQARKRPKWRKRWFPVAFVAWYIPLAVISYLWDREQGLRWYNYVGQYGILVPFLAALPASYMLTRVRRYTRARKQARPR